MSSFEEAPLSHPEVRAIDTRHYLGGFAVTVVLLTIAFLAVVRHAWAIPGLAIVIAAAGGLAAIGQLILVLQLTLAPSQRWFTACFILYIPLYILTIGLTAWMFATLYTRTMMPQLMS